MSFILGIDDAGRGPLIGPMILAGVLIEKKDEIKLKEIGAKDSKLLSHENRIKIAKLIKAEVISFFSVVSNPEEIDDAVFSGKNLNTLEAEKAAKIINKLNDGKKEIFVIIDCPSVNTEAWKNKVLSFVENKKNLRISCEHKADFKYPSVSAASIIAKVEREERVEEIKKKFSGYGEVGSGYPSDPKTKMFLKEFGKELADSGIFRKSWATWKEIFSTEEK